MKLNIDTDKLEEQADVLERLFSADTYLAEVARMEEELKRVRAEALRQLVNTVGGARAADLTNLNRASLYRAIRKGVSSDEIERDDAYWHQQAQRLNASLRRLGWSSDQVNHWWNDQGQRALGGRTPLQAWTAGDQQEVLKLVPRDSPGLPPVGRR